MFNREYQFEGPAEASTSTDQDSLILKENKNTRKNGTLLLMDTLGKKTEPTNQP
jgi:hypothetical protein